MRDFVIFCYGVLVVGSVCGIVAYFLSASDHHWFPFTAVSRAWYRRTRRIDARIAELMDRGFDHDDARYKAAEEERKQAKQASDELKKAGIE